MLNQSRALDLAFQALADPTRRGMVERLTRDPVSVSELARPCRINPESLSLAEQWINSRRMEWERRLDRLGDYLATLKAEGDDHGAKS